MALKWVAATEAIVLAIYAQFALRQSIWWGVTCYLLAGAMWLWSEASLGWSAATPLPPLGPPLGKEETQLRVRRGRWAWLGLSGVATAITVAYLGNNTLTPLRLAAWLVSVGAFVAAFWVWERRERSTTQSRRGIPVAWLQVDAEGWRLRLSWFAVGVGIVACIGLGFRLWQLDVNPPAANYDHLKNLTDVYEVLHAGSRPLFFLRNNGREPLAFYVTAALVRLTGLPVGFYALKLSSVLMEVATLPAVYLLGRELYGRRGGFWALFFTAVASWPVILARLGLRCSLAPMISAWVFYVTIRGLRTGRRNDFLALGVLLGVGLYGYTAFRIVPLAVVACWLVGWAIGRRDGQFPRLRMSNVVLCVLTALLVFLPLGLFMIFHPTGFWNRVFWYLVYNDPAGPPGVILLKNLKNLLLMFHWRGDTVVWSSLPGEPVLDPVMGGVMVLGVVTLLVRLLAPVFPRGEKARYAALLAGGFVALLPSALSLSFPEENPSVLRTCCAIPVVFTIVAGPVAIWTERMWRAWPRSWMRGLAGVGLALLALSVIRLNATRVFETYVASYRAVATDLSEVVAAIRGFEATLGSADDVYIVAWPGWIDGTALAFELGRPPGWSSHQLENAGQASTHTHRSRPGMYILHANDVAGLHTLEALFPHGLTRRVSSRWGPAHDFVLYIVQPAAEGEGERGGEGPETRGSGEQVE